MMSETEFRRRFLELSLDRNHPARRKLAAYPRRGPEHPVRPGPGVRPRPSLAHRAKTQGQRWAAATVRDATNFQPRGVNRCEMRSPKNCSFFMEKARISTRAQPLQTHVTRKAESGR